RGVLAFEPHAALRRHLPVGGVVVDVLGREKDRFLGLRVFIDHLHAALRLKAALFGRPAQIVELAHGEVSRRARRCDFGFWILDFGFGGGALACAGGLRRFGRRGLRRKRKNQVLYV